MDELNLQNIVAAGFKSHASSRPVANISFALNYYFHKYEVAGYHLVNTAIHILTGIFMYLFVKETFRSPALKGKYKDTNVMAFLAALLWLVHPIQTQAVTYIVQRMTSMAVMFYILSFLLYVKGRFAMLAKEKSRLWFAGSIVAGIMALGCKQIAATLPVFILLYEWYFFQDLDINWLKQKSRYAAGIFVIFCFVGLVYLGRNPLDKIFAEYSHRDFTLIERVLTQFRVVVFYIGLLVFPHPGRLNLDHYFAISHSLINPVTTVLSLTVIAGFVGLAVYLARRQRLLSFCILWFFGNLVIESSILALELVFEHRLYLPSIFVSVAAAVLVYRFIKPNRVRVIVFCAAAVLLGLWTYERNKVYSNAVTLWQDCVNKSPQKYRPHINLGNVLKDSGKVTEAIEHFNKAMALKGESAEIYNNLGNVYRKIGRIEESIRYYKKALGMKRNFWKARYNLAVALAEQGETDEAIAEYRKALKLGPEDIDTLNNLGLLLAKQGKNNEATGYYNKTIALAPNNAIAHGRLGMLLAGEGKTDEAIEKFRIVLKLRPRDLEMYCNLGILLDKQGRINEAIEQYRRALQVNPNYTKAANLLKGALAKPQGQ
jgi:tetratricopeptide (TPR) repeat protein